MGSVCDIILLFCVWCELRGDSVGASLVISYFSFSSLILSLIVMISFYILSKRLFLKRKGLSDVRVVSITKKEYGYAVHFL